MHRLPGLIEVVIVDGAGKKWVMVDKYPMFGKQVDVTSESRFPIEIDIACTEIERSQDGVLVSVADPWGLETRDRLNF